MNKKKNLKYIFSPNRAEEFGHDVWEHFVIPLFFDDLDLFGARKARVVRGGRGCGKTMLLRYLSHYSQFSRNRQVITDEDLQYIGLYWRSDTSFAAGLKGWGIDDDTWSSAFEHAMTLTISIEILKSVLNIADSNYQNLDRSRLEQIKFDSLAAFDEDLYGNVFNILDALTQKNWSFQTWVNNPQKIDQPKFLPGKYFIEAVLSIVQESIDVLKSSMYYVYIDEYENLQEYQQRIINTYIKHGEPPLIFNIATKHNGIRTYETTGNESIQNVSDYRVVNLDELILDNEYELFAAEVLFSRLINSISGCDIVNPDTLRTRDNINHRKKKEYKQKIIERAEIIFPNYSQSELSEVIFNSRLLTNKIKENIYSALKERNSKYNLEDFYRDNQKEATIIVSCLLNRKSNLEKDIISELDKLNEGKENKFTGKTNWIHNNFVGEVLRLYESTNSKVCTFYSGFNTFTSLSRGNLRHFLELCYTSIRQKDRDVDIDDLIIPQEEQAAAAREASISFIKDIRGLGQYGNKLHAFVLALGSLFSMAHSRKSQSEPEINHFVIGGKDTISDEEQSFLDEAVKWSILFEEEETKVKTDLQVIRRQWVINPIYAPYFLISYRKKRKLELSSKDVSILISGTYEQKRNLIKEYMQKWQLISNDLNMSLFAHLED